MDFLPGLRWHALTPLYDGIMRLVMPGKRYRALLRECAGVEPGHRVLDLGCGTGTLAIELAEHEPDATVAAIDVDPRMLARARGKPGADRVAFHDASALALPFEDRAFDRVVTTLLLHHLTSDEKVAALREAYRVLTPGGEVWVLDWGRPRGRLARLGFLGVRLVDGFARTADHAEGRLGERLRQAGFADVEDGGVCPTWFGTLRVLRAERPV